MAVLCGMKQYSIRLEEVRAICAQAVYFLHSTMPNVTCHYLPCYLFSVSNSVCFSSISVGRQHSGVLIYAIWDIGRC